MRLRALQIQEAEARRERARNMRRDGCTLKEIGEAFGVSGERAYQLVRDKPAPEQATCRTCGTEFTRRPWQVRKHDSQCLTCHNNDQQDYKRSERCRDVRRERAVRDRDAGLTREGDRRHGQRSRLKYPEKWRAREITRNALRRGDLVRPEQCQRCGSVPTRSRAGLVQIHAHHVDYANPLEIEWLCSRCHRDEHRRALGFDIREE